VRDPRLAQVPLANSTVGDTVISQVRFAFAGKGPLAGRKLVPETAGAQQLLAGPSGAAVEQDLRGLLSIADRSGTGANHLRGISFSSSWDGWKANLVATQAENSVIGRSRSADDPKWLAEVNDVFADGDLGHQSKTGAYALKNWIDFAPQYSLMFLQHAAGKSLTSLVPQFMKLDDLPPPPPNHSGLSEAQWGDVTTMVMRHEFEHEITGPYVRTNQIPAHRYHVPNDPDGPELSVFWTEEGTAQTLTQWPGQIDAAARKMGLPHDESQMDDPHFKALMPYPVYVHAVQSLLALADIDPRKAGDFSRADSVLQRRDSADFPRSVAAAIAIAHHLNTPDRRWVEGQIRAMQPDSIETVKSAVAMIRTRVASSKAADESQ